MTSATNTQQTDPQPFAGINVVEFGQFVAVPFCAQLLAEGGARVTKIESLAGDPTRLLAPIAPMETRTFISRNRGKRSLPLNLRHPEAAEVVASLLEQADVVLTNFRPGRAEELGLDAATLLARWPKLIVGNVTAFGRQGPEAKFAGMDIAVQARSGLMAANGRMIDGRPAPGDPVSADYMCAMTMAFGVSAALLRRERTGRGGAVNTSLMQAAMTLSNNQLVRSEDKDRPVHKAALQRLAEQRAAGVSYEEQLNSQPSARTSALMRVYFRTYATADGTIAIGCGSLSLRQKFIVAIGMADEYVDPATAPGEVPAGYYEGLATEVEGVFRAQSTAHWVACLNVAGVPVAAVRFPMEMFDDEQVRANGFLHLLEHPTAGDLQVVAPPLSLDSDGFRAARPTAAFASEARQILLDAGLEEAKIDALIADQVTRVEA